MGTKEQLQGIKADMENHKWLSDPEQANSVEMELARHVKTLIGMVEGCLYHRLRAETEIGELRRLCREAGNFYAQGGTFPIKGQMSSDLINASNGGLAAPHHSAG